MQQLETQSPGIYSCTTRAITVSVEPEYLDDQSEPEENRFVWAYHVHIQNNGFETVQLTRRYWKITDAAGQVQEVEGPGVIGEQPVLGPGDSFEYTSGTPLKAPSGIMMGRYTMETKSGEAFDVDIPAFSLDSPFESRLVH